MTAVWRNLSVLVVDDFEPMRKVTANQLRSIGIDRIAMASDGAEALRLLQRQPFDIVLSDWSMPVMNGLELLRKVRENEKLSQLPFVMITAESDRRRVAEAIAHGVSDLLVKPYNAGRLDAALQTAMAQRARRATRPLAEQAATVEAPPVVVPAEPERLTILVVDDNPQIAMLFHNLFGQDYRVRFAHNGPKALSICESDNPPDLVLLDVMMPGMTGFEVARAMREHPQSAHIPVIFVTAMEEAEAGLQGWELGAIDFVSKPIVPEQLALRVKNFMEYVQLRKSLQSNYDALLEVGRLRDCMDDIVRHDMKSPLAAMIGLLQELLASDELSWRQSSQVTAIEQTAYQLLNTINLSSELYKIETGRFKLLPQPVELGAMLRRIVEATRVTFNSKHLTISVDTDTPVGVPAPLASADPTLCYSVFNNLITNACEAAPEASLVSILLSATDTIQVSVQNKGVIAPEIRSRFFEKYVTSGKTHGTGLGTYSARLLTEAQHGEVAFVVSDDDKSTTLTVTLPAWAG